MVYASHLPEDIEDAHGFGWSVAKPTHDWQRFISNKNKEITRLNGIYGSLLDNAGVTLITGTASVTGDHEVTVNGKVYTAERILVAVGGKPIMPSVPGIEYAISSDQLFFLDEMPKRTYCCWRWLYCFRVCRYFCRLRSGGDGCFIEVTTLCVIFDHSISAHLLSQMQQKGIHFELGKKVVALELNCKNISINQEVITVLDCGKQLISDQVLYAVGRSGYVDNLGLQALGVTVSGAGVIEVNEQFQTAVPSIYALGDVIGTPALTPIALAQAMALVNHLYGDNSQSMSYEAIPTAVFTQPNIATVGLTEHDALEAGHKINVYQSDFRHLKHTLTQSKERVLMKLIVEQGSDIVLGIHMIGPDSGEIIQGFSLAVKCKLKKSDLDSVIGIHPTAAEEFVTMRQLSYSKP